MELTEVTEVPVDVDCEYASFSDYWATFTSGQGRFASLLTVLSMTCAAPSSNMFVTDIWSGCLMDLDPFP